MLANSGQFGFKDQVAQVQILNLKLLRLDLLNTRNSLSRGYRPGTRLPDYIPNKPE